jgi:hypothetical protein
MSSILRSLRTLAQFRKSRSAAYNGEFNLEGSCHAEGKLKFFAWLLCVCVGGQSDGR